MWLQFFLTNIHFGISLFAALVMFSVAWLYLDAWLLRRNTPDTFKIIGFVLMSLGFVLRATYVETDIFVTAAGLSSSVGVLHLVLASIGSLFAMVGLAIEPIQPKPKHPDESDKTVHGFMVSAVALPLLAVKTFGTLGILALYLRRATIGLERHLMRVVLSFLFLFIADLLGLAALFRGTTNVALYTLVAPFGPLWIAENAFLLVGAALLRAWVFTYLLKRVTTQLFMIATTAVAALFVITTVTFTSLLMKNIEEGTLSALATDAKILTYAVESRKSEALSDAQLVAENAAVSSALSVSSGSRATVADIAEATLLTKKQSQLIMVNGSGQVVARGEDRERIGDSLSDDGMVKRALSGEAVSGLDMVSGVLAPTVLVRAAVPIKHDGSVVGAVLVGSVLDAAFVDGVKKATGLTATVYGGDTVSSTSLEFSGLVGLKEKNPSVLSLVLKDGTPFVGETDVTGIPYYASYIPLRDADNTIIGMVWVGVPQTTVLAAAGRSVELTFLVSVILLLLSTVPAYVIARGIEQQFKA